MILASLTVSSPGKIKLEIISQLHADTSNGVKKFINNSMLSNNYAVHVDIESVVECRQTGISFILETQSTTNDFNIVVDETMKLYEFNVLKARHHERSIDLLATEIVPIPYSASRTQSAIAFALLVMIVKACWQADSMLSDPRQAPSLAPKLLSSGRNLSSERIKKKFRGLLLHEQWRMGYGAVPSDMDFAKAMHSIKWLPVPDDGTFTADPFVLMLNNEPWIIYEHLDTNNIGSIRIIRANAKSFSESTTLLSTGKHLSYPFVFTDDGDTYIIPESSAALNTTMYQLDQTSMTLTPKYELLTGIGLVDPTIFKKDGVYWLFGSVAGLAENSSVFAWHTETLNGPWTPHNQNPIKISTRSARPAGTPYRKDGALIRPSQDCVGRYGAAITLCKIDLLSATEFIETEIQSIQPDPKWPNTAGIHNIGINDGFFVIDALRDHVSLHQIKSNLR